MFGGDMLKVTVGVEECTEACALIHMVSVGR
jgi:hypothetical protein